MSGCFSALRCPVCGGKMSAAGGALRCESGHAFDFAREGYVNLLRSNKPGNSTGDSRRMAAARRAFLESGCFSPLKDALGGYLAEADSAGAKCDICCGEGYYTSALGGGEVYAFDLSKEMVRLAAKRSQATCFVANIAAIPLADESVGAAIHLFAPFHSREFKRIMRPDGVLLTAVAGRRHLFAMKEIMYAHPYENDEKPPEADGFKTVDTLRVRSNAVINGSANIAALLEMTPYGVHTPPDGKQRLLSLDTLETELEFVVYVMKRV